ncbi:AAA family ATPase [Kribbella sp. CA-294648]|uniref:AAA family ATPase n=1 Tax=Kribbella sp. CA-294648 TaxID=3239948 RepID=UPI003D9052CB
MPAGPFATGSGRLPEYVAVRTDSSGRSISLADYPPQRWAVLLTGAQGMGKSVELTRAELAARQAGAIVVRVDASPREALEDRFARAVTQDLGSLRKQHGFRAVRKLNKLLKTLSTGSKLSHSGGDVRVGMPPLTMSVNHGVEDTAGAPTGQLTQLADALNELGQKKRRAVVLMVDNIDVASDRDLSALNELSAHLERTGQPAHLVTAGGQKAVGRLLAASQKTTGVESAIAQLYDIRECRPLGDDEALAAMRSPLAKLRIPAEAAAVTELVDAANGSPQRLQALAATATAMAASQPLGLDSRVAKAAVEQLTSQSRPLYEALWNNSSDGEKDLLARTAVRGTRGLAMSSVTQQAGPEHWAAVDSSRQSLKSRGILRQGEESGRLRFADPGMLRWVQTHVGQSAAHLGVAMPTVTLGAGSNGARPAAARRTAGPGQAVTR